MPFHEVEGFVLLLGAWLFLILLSVIFFAISMIFCAVCYYVFEFFYKIYERVCLHDEEEI